jgi:serine/threonine protein kinase/tetratricopeptide (TPR) repeat protein
MSSTSRAGLPDGSALGTDRFVVERQLGEGSMGAVYLALDRERQSRVALKTLRRVDPSGIYRFKREFRALTDVSHKNLVQFYELFSAGREWFFTMEYVEGKDFLAYLLGPGRRPSDTMHNARRTKHGGGRPGPRARGMEVLFPTPLEDLERLRDVLRQVTEGLLAVHAAGKLHRDLKPDNVLVTREGRAVVLDFGIAFELHQDSHGTMEAGVMGTPAYMAPEQAGGETVNERTDFYALGAMLYEALTGQVPFEGAYMDVLRHKQAVDPRPPSELVSEVPDDLNALCVRLLSRNPDERPDGNEILEALGGERRMSRPSGNIDVDPSLYGREAQIGELQRAFAATVDGTPSVVFVRATTGMGKSTLVERFLDGVQQAGPAVVLQGRCYEHEMVPFKALDSVIDSLSRYLGRIAPTDASEVMPKDVHELAQLFPVLRRVDAVQSARRRERGPREPRIVRRLATHALKELLMRIAMREPLVMFIDDLQWGDVDSARLIADLVTGTESPPMLVVCTYRTADRDRSACLSTLFALLKERTALDVRDIALDPLTDHERIELARRLMPQGSEQQLEAIARESRGSPYLLTQLVEHLYTERASLPPGDRRVIEISLDRALSGRLDTLSSSATSVLELVTVAGRPVRDEIVAQLIAAEVDLATALSELRRARLVRGIGTGDDRAIAIYDDSIRDAVLGRMAEGLIRNWHRRLATAIEGSRAPDLEALTDHLLGAQDNARAGIYAIRAASQAMQALAFDKAADLYEIAVRHHEDGAWRHELLLQWADALVSAGKSTRAAEIYLEAAEGAPEEDAPALRRKAGLQLLFSGRYKRGVEIISPTLAELGMVFPEDAKAALEGTAKLMPKIQERGLELKPKRRADIPVKALERVDAIWSVVQATFSASPVAAQAFTLHHLLEALEVGERTRVIIGMCAYFITVDLAFSSLAGNKPKTLQAAEALARDVDDPRCQAWVEFARAFAYHNDGMLKPAALAFAQALQSFRDRCTNVTPELRACQMLNARVLVQLGQLEELTVCEGWIREADDSDDLLTATRLRLAIVPRMLLDDDMERANHAVSVPTDVHSDPNDLTHILIMLARTSLALYVDSHDDHVRALEIQDKLRKSPLFGIRIWRADSTLARARLLLAAARHEANRSERLAQADRALAVIDKVALESHVDHARMLRAGLAYLRGQHDETLRWLDAILSDADMGGESRVIRACAQWRKGELIGGPDGEALIRQGEAELRGRGAKDPSRFARIYSPGFG